MDGVLAKGGKVLEDLAEMGYVVAELAGWVGPTSAETAQVGGQVAQAGAQVAQEVPRSLAGAQAGAERLAVTQQQPAYGIVGAGNQVSQAGSQLAGQLPQAGAQAQQANQSATLTEEEVGLLAQYQVTYQNGRWVHTEHARAFELGLIFEVRKRVGGKNLLFTELTEKGDKAVTAIDELYLLFEEMFPE